MKSSRIRWIDVAKGITIVLMVLGHSSISPIYSNFIWAFHMPLFFIASGWVTNWGGTNFNEFFKKKIRSLIVPFFIYSLLILLIQRHYGWIDFTHWISNGWISYALWFIPVLFFATIFGKLIRGLQGRFSSVCIALALFGISGFLSNYKIYLPWSLSSVPYATALVVVGSELKKITPIISGPNPWYILFSFLITLGIAYFWRLDLCFNAVVPLLPLTTGAIVGTLFIFMVSARIHKEFSHVSIFFQRIGRETFLILSFSQVIIMVLNEHFSLHPVSKYLLLVLFLTMLKNIKDVVNKFTKIRIL